MKQLNDYIIEKANFLVKKHITKVSLDKDTLFKIFNREKSGDVIESCSKVNCEFKLDKQKYSRCTALIIYQDDFELDPDYILFIFLGNSDAGDILDEVRDYINLDKQHNNTFKWTNNDIKAYLECYTTNKITNTTHRSVFRLIEKDEYTNFNIIKRW